MMPTWLPVKLTAGTPRSVEGHRQQRGRHPLAGGQQHVHLPARAGGRHLGGEGDQVVGGLAHRRHDDHDVVAVALGDLHVLGDGPHAVRVGDGRAAVLLDDEGHGARAYRWVDPGRLLTTLGDVLHDLEAEQVGTGRHRLAVGGLGAGVAVLERRAVDPRLERLLAVPAGVDEVALLALDRSQQLELLEPGHLLDAAGAGGEARLQLRSGARSARRWH